MPIHLPSVPLPIVHILAMGDPSDVHHPRSVVNRVNDAMIPDANSPAVPIAVQLLAASGTWIGRKFTDSRNYAPDDVGRQVTKLFFGRSGKRDEIFCHFNLPTARNSASTSAKVERRSPALASDTAPSSMSSASIESAVATTSSESR